jgi:hypothetical protein
MPVAPNTPTFSLLTASPSQSGRGDYSLVHTKIPTLPGQGIVGRIQKN